VLGIHLHELHIRESLSGPLKAREKQFASGQTGSWIGALYVEEHAARAAPDFEDRGRSGKMRADRPANECRPVAKPEVEASALTRASNG
jgi:hypothetical protein